MAEDQTYQQKEWLARTANGDENAFAQIVKLYTPVVYPHLVTFIKDAQKAQELTQDVFMSIWRNRQKLAEMENFPGYLHVITRNKIRKALVQLAAENELLPEDKLESFFQDPEVRIELKELNNIIDNGIESLPLRRREVFKMSRMENKNYEEIARELGVSRSAVKQHIIAAMAFLRTYIKERTGIVVSFVVMAISGTWKIIINFFSY